MNKNITMLEFISKLQNISTDRITLYLHASKHDQYIEIFTPNSMNEMLTFDLEVTNLDIESTIKEILSELDKQCNIHEVNNND